MKRMTDTMTEVIMRANDGWIPVEAGLPIPYEIVAVTLQDQRGVRLWTRAYVNDDGQWRRDWNNIDTLPGVLAWKRILPWTGEVAEKGE